MRVYLALVLGELLLWGATGCAIHRYDPKTGGHTVYGVGVLRMRTFMAPTGQQAVATSLATFGTTLEVGSEDFGIALGYVRRDRLSIVGENTAIALAYEQGSLFSAEFVDVPQVDTPPDEDASSSRKDRPASLHP